MSLDLSLGSSINNVTALGGREYQGFCDNSTKALVVKSMTIGEGVYKIIKNCVTSFVDDRFVCSNICFTLLCQVVTDRTRTCSAAREDDGRIGEGRREEKTARKKVKKRSSGNLKTHLCVKYQLSRSNFYSLTPLCVA